MRGIEDGWPDFSPAALAATVTDWLAPHLAGMTNFRDVQALDFCALLKNALGYQRAAALDKALPPFLDFPAGRVPVDYTGPLPLAAAKAKLFYGTDETPRLANGKLPLQIALLSPALRPIAVTADLAAFWRAGWKDARKDMRGRYPKHDWPEEPWRPAASGP
jgi:ATP-dependent helicase HrpB